MLLLADKTIRVSSGAKLLLIRPTFYCKLKERVRKAARVHLSAGFNDDIAVRKARVELRCSILGIAHLSMSHCRSEAADLQTEYKQRCWRPSSSIPPSLNLSGVNNCVYYERFQLFRILFALQNKEGKWLR